MQGLERAGPSQISHLFYKELNRILGGDASVHPRRVGCSMPVFRARTKEEAVCAVPKGSEELF